MKSCLIVDDSGPIRAVAAEILRRLGMDTSQAASGFEALETCRSRLPDSILLDWNMPGMDGLELLSALKSAVPASEMPTVIFCTAETSVRRISEALAAGARGYIMKPFDRHTLETTLRNLALVS